MPASYTFRLAEHPVIPTDTPFGVKHLVLTDLRGELPQATLELIGARDFGGRDDGKVEGYEWRSPRLREGDRFPILGSIYRVTSIGHGSMSVERVKDEDRLAGVPSRWDRFAIPPGGVLKAQENNIVVDGITTAADGGGAEARLTVHPLLGRPREWRGVHEGDTIRVKIWRHLVDGPGSVGEQSFRIGRIVAPDPHRQWLGSVELVPTSAVRD